jgi:hypothetical protein
MIGAFRIFGASLAGSTSSSVFSVPSSGSQSRKSFSCFTTAGSPSCSIVLSRTPTLEFTTRKRKFSLAIEPFLQALEQSWPARLPERPAVGDDSEIFDRAVRADHFGFDPGARRQAGIAADDFDLPAMA